MAGRAHVRHDDGEDEKEQQRIHADANDERQQLPAKHEEVAKKEPTECTGISLLTADDGWRGENGNGLHEGAPELFAQLAAGEADEDGFEAGLRDSKVAQAKRIGGADDLR